MSTALKLAILSVLILSCFSENLQGTVTSTISNVIPRKDDAGNIMDVHDGNTFYNDQDGKYYYFGAAYGDCIEPEGGSGCSGSGLGACGFQTNHNVSLYTSVDLQNWHFEGHIFQMQDAGLTNAILFAPKVIFNKKTNLWVLWFNWIEGADFSKSVYAVATSQTAKGPYKLVNSKVTTIGYGYPSGDFGLFLDDNKQDAYIIYTSHITGAAPTHLMSVEKLSDDFQSTLGLKFNSGYFGQQFVEAPAMFKRNGVYVAVFGTCCCYCNNAEPVIYYTSKSPLGPYKQQTAMYQKGNIVSQLTNILVYNGPDGDNYLLQGDMWQSSPDRIKSHDFSYWGYFEFNGDGTIKQMVHQDNFQIQVKTPQLMEKDQRQESEESQEQVN